MSTHNPDITIAGDFNFSSIKWEWEEGILFYQCFTVSSTEGLQQRVLQPQPKHYVQGQNFRIET